MVLLGSEVAATSAPDKTMTLIPELTVNNKRDLMPMVYLTL